MPATAGQIMRFPTSMFVPSLFSAHDARAGPDEDERGTEDARAIPTSIRISASSSAPSMLLSSNRAGVMRREHESQVTHMGLAQIPQPVHRFYFGNLRRTSFRTRDSLRAAGV